MSRYHLPEWATTFYDVIKQSDTDVKKIIISDVDGILTSGVLGYTKDGKVMKFFGGHDKEAINICVNLLGWDLHFVSDDAIGWDITDARLSHIKKLNADKITYELADADKRLRLVEEYMAKGYKVLFIGDSISDIAALNKATIAATTNNAANIVKLFVDYASNIDGGNGGFADILTRLLIDKAAKTDKATI